MSKPAPKKRRRRAEPSTVAPLSVDSGAGGAVSVVQPSLAAEAAASLGKLLRPADAPGTPDDHAGLAGNRLLDLIPLAVCVCDADGRIALHNRRALELWGRPPPAGAVTSLGVFQRVLSAEGRDLPPEDWPAVRAVREARPVRGQHALVERADGVRLEVSVNVDLVLDGAGQVTGTVAVLQDVTESRRHERATALLSQLAEQVASLTQEREMLGVTARLLCTHLEVDAGGFLEVPGSGGAGVVVEEWRRDASDGARLAALSQLTGRDRDGWGEREMLVVDDVTTHPLTRDGAAALVSQGIGTVLMCRLGSSRSRGLAFAAVGDRPRGWRADEVRLLEQGLGRVWPLVQRARASAALHRSEEQLREVAQALPVAFYACDREGRITSYNEAAVVLWGRVPDAARDRWCASPRLFRRDGTEVPVPSCPMAVAVRDGRVERGEEVIIERADGSRRHVLPHLQVIRDEAGEITGAINILIDISARREGELEQQRNAARFRALIRAVPAIVWTARADGTIDFVSEQWRDYVGAAPGEGSGDAETIHPEDRARQRAAWSAAVRSGGDYENESRLRRHDGEYRWFLTRAVAARSDAGEVLGWYGTSTDIHALKVTARALHESETRIGLATRTGKIGIWDWNVASGRVAWTDSLYAIHGVDRATFGHTPEAFLELLHTDDRPHVRRALQSSLDHDVPYELEYRTVRPNGRVIWLYAHATVVRERGRPVRMLGATFDITARKQAETALRESEGRFRALASHAPVGIFLTDTAGDVLYGNETWRSLAGVGAGPVAGRGWMSPLHPEDRERVATEWQAAVAARRPFASEYRFLRPDGRVTWLLGSAVEFRQPNGALVGFLGTVADITQRKAAEDALRESEHRFRTLASHAPVGIFVTDAAGETTFVNERWCAMTGVMAPAAQGQEWLRSVHSDDRERIQQEWAEALRQRRASNAEYRFVGESGRVTWVQGYAVPMFGAERELTGYIGTVADVTERRNAEERLQAHAQELEEKVAARTASLREAIAQMEEFSYSVSHDLRAPLRAMQSYADVLLEEYGPQLDDTARHYLTRIQRSSVRMEKLTHDVLTYSRVARAEIMLEDLDLETLVRELVAQYAELQPSAADVELVLPLARVRAHELSLGQCLTNLLINAAKFVAPGVRPRVRVRTEEAGGRVRVWIEDNGIGLAPEHAAKLFQVFERAPTAQGYEGTGIGLAIVRKAVEKMSGRCGVESDGRTGSRFWIEIPSPAHG